MNVNNRQNKVTSIANGVKRARTCEGFIITKVVGDQDPLALDSLERKTLAAKARQIRRSRRLRTSYLSQSLFGEPGWDILLTLYAEAGQRSMNATGAAVAANAAESTTARWLDILETSGLIESRAHMTDKRLRLLQLTDRASIIMDHYLADILHDGA